MAVMDYRDDSFMELAFQHVSELECKWKQSEEAAGNLNKVREDFSLKGRHASHTVLVQDSNAWHRSNKSYEKLVWPVEEEKVDNDSWKSNKVRSRAASASEAVLPRIRETMQLLQASLWWSDLDLRHGAIKGNLPRQHQPSTLQGLPVELMAAAKSVWQDSAASSVMISAVQREVFSGLQQELGVTPKVIRSTYQISTIGVRGFHSGHVLPNKICSGRR
jgi:hypothetical protein